MDAKDIQCDVFGLNHLNYAYNLRIKGRPLTAEEFEKAAKAGWGVSADLAIKIGALLSGYLQYYYHTKEVYEKLKEAPQTRGESVLELEKEIFADFNNPVFDEKPPSLQKRGCGGYAEVAVAVMDAIHNNRDTCQPGGCRWSGGRFRSWRGRFR